MGSERWRPLDPSLGPFLRSLSVPRDSARGARRADSIKSYIELDSPLHEFLRSDEWQHLHLASMFLPQQHELARAQRQFCILREQSKKALVYQSPARGGAVEAVLLWSRHRRLLFDCLALRQSQQFLASGGLNDGQVLPALLLEQLQTLVERYVPRQFIGTKLHYDFLMRHCDLRLKERLYLMMVRKPLAAGEGQASREWAGQGPCLESGLRLGSGRRLQEGMRLERLQPDHFQQLLPLELAYYVEEVLLGPADAQMQRALERECARRLQQFLQYGVFAGKELLARIMINAYGLYYWQIGGIYTAPCWRSQGLATFLLHKMCRVIEDAGRMPMLFVREENPGAQLLYSKNGFEVLDRMVIAQDNL